MGLFIFLFGLFHLRADRGGGCLGVSEAVLSPPPPLFVFLPSLHFPVAGCLARHHETCRSASVRLTPGNCSTFAHLQPLVRPALPAAFFFFYTALPSSAASGAATQGMFVPRWVFVVFGPKVPRMLLFLSGGQSFDLLYVSFWFCLLLTGV